MYAACACACASHDHQALERACAIVCAPASAVCATADRVAFRPSAAQPSLRMRAQRDVLADARNHGENRVLAACVGEPWVDIFDFPGPPTARGGRCQSALARGQRPCGANGIDLMTGISARRRPTDAGRR